MFDEGICKICQLENIAKKGDKPQYQRLEKSKHWYEMRVVGINRYYAALQANNSIDYLIRIWQDQTITARDYCVLEDGKQYRITQVQHLLNDDGLKITDLSLERVDKLYDLTDAT